MARYARHLPLAQIGPAGQERLRAARVLVVGAGGLGSPVLLYLAAAGVGVIGVVDFDTVAESNLQRQVIYTASDLGQPKAACAAQKLQAMNPGVTARAHQVALTASNASAIISGYDVVVDCVDNYPARYLVNDTCAALGLPDVHGSISQCAGQVSVFQAGHGPCYRCLYPQTPPAGMWPNCADAGVLGVLPGVIGAIQATEALKLIVGGGDPLIGRVLLYDAWSMRFRELELAKDPHCLGCADPPM
jgi:adenylyltransferase/sulfurtransferase